MSASPRYAGAVCRARDLIAELNIQDPKEIVIEKIAPFKGAPVRYAELTGCDGRMVRENGTALITVNESITRLGQRRFIIAHELGHVLMHPNICQMDEVDVRQTRNFNHRQRPEELEANYFAAELLMPKKFFEKDSYGIIPTWEKISRLAERYQTTLSSTAIQLVHSTKEALCLVASEACELKWFVISDGARDFYVNDDIRMRKYTCAHELMAEGITHSRSDKIPAGCWFRGFDPNSKVYITEDSMRASGSDFILSLIWVHEDI